MTKIDKGIPLPTHAVWHEPYVPRYPFADMKPGDSFFAPGVKGTTMSNEIARDRRRTGTLARFAVRSVTEGGKQGVRIWRTL
jgi:hypothetical protein